MQTLSQREYDLLARKFEHDSDVNYVAFADYIDPENSAPTRCNIGRYAATCRNVLQYGTFADYIDPEDSVHQSILVTVLKAPSQLMRSVSMSRVFAAGSNIQCRAFAVLFKTMPATGIVDMSTTSQERQRPIEIHSKMDTCASGSSTARRICTHCTYMGGRLQAPGSADLHDELVAVTLPMGRVFAFVCAATQSTASALHNRCPK